MPEPPPEWKLSTQQRRLPPQCRVPPSSSPCHSPLLRALVVIALAEQLIFYMRAMVEYWTVVQLRTVSSRACHVGYGYQKRTWAMNPLLCPFPSAALGNRRLKQHEVSARLARVQPDDRATLGSECKTFRLAVQIAEPPRIDERRGAAARRQSIKPRDCGRLVAEQIKAAIRTYLEITEVSAGFGQCLVGEPDCDSNELVMALFNRPPLAARKGAAAG